MARKEKVEVVVVVCVMCVHKNKAQESLNKLST